MACLLVLLLAGWILLNGAARVTRLLSPADLAVLTMFFVAAATSVAMFRFLGELFDTKVVRWSSLHPF